MKIIGKLQKIVDVNGAKEVTFTINNYIAKEQLETLQPGDYSLEIEEFKNKRTKQQNKYMWKLIKEISDRMNGVNSNEWDVYLLGLERANVKYEYVMTLPQAETLLRQNFRAIKFVRKQEKYNIYKCYYGSSKFDKQEMKDLIDALLNMAYQVGIETSYYEQFLY